MKLSEVFKLKTFINTLPKDKVLSDAWDERYIDDLDTYPGYDNAKLLAIKRNRYVNIDDMVIDGYSLVPYESLCDDLKIKKTECSECCSESDEGECVYDEYKCNQFFAQNVHNWSELCGYHILFLQGKTPGTPDHPGPWNKETIYIIDPLIRILKHNILTMDSQPGLIVQDDNIDTIQKPYLRIGGPVNRIHRILIKILFPAGETTLDNTIIKYVPTTIRKIDFNQYINYDNNNTEYMSVMLGIETPNVLLPEYNDYLFSNRFFDYIADIVSTTP